MIDAGRLREEILIQTVTESTAAGSGAVSTAPATFWDTRAEVIPLASDEAFDGDASTRRARYRVTTRYKAGIVTTMQVAWNGLTLQILSAVPDVLRTEVVMECVVDLSRG